MTLLLSAFNSSQCGQYFLFYFGKFILSKTYDFCKNVTWSIDGVTVAKHFPKMFAFIFEFQIDMEAPDFKDFAKSMTDYIAEYLENIRDR